MTVQTINIGNQVNDGLGDDLRTAFEKVNSNFSELGAALTITVSNLGSGAVKGIFKEKVGSDLKFKSLTEGNYITLTTNDDVIEIANSMPDSFYKITTDSGVIEAATLSSRGHISFSGTAASGSTTSRKDIEITAFGPTVYFKTIIPVTDILTSYDFGTITGSYNNSMQMLHQASNIDFGTITIPGRLDIDCGSIL